MKGTTMRTYVLAILTAALFVLPTSAFSQVDFEVGPGWRGVYIPHGNRYGGGQCRELRQACLHKEELGVQGMGNCRRYRKLCR